MKKNIKGILIGIAGVIFAALLIVDIIYRSGGSLDNLISGVNRKGASSDNIINDASKDTNTNEVESVNDSYISNATELLEGDFDPNDMDSLNEYIKALEEDMKKDKAIGAYGTTESKSMVKYSFDNLLDGVSISNLENYAYYGAVSWVAIKNGDEYSYCDADIRVIPYALNSDGYKLAILDKYIPVFQVSKKAGDQLMVINDNNAPKEIYRVKSDSPLGYLLPVALHNHSLSGEFKASIPSQINPFFANTDNALDLIWKNICSDPINENCWARLGECASGFDVFAIDGQSPFEWLSQNAMDIFAGYCDESDGVLYGKIYDSDSPHIVTFRDQDSLLDVYLYNSFALYDYDIERVIPENYAEGYLLYDISHLPNGRYVFCGGENMSDLRGVILDIMD